MTNPPIDAQFHLFSAIRSAISAVTPVPVYAIRAPEPATPPFFVLRLQDDVRAKVYTAKIAARTILSIVSVAETSQEAWQNQTLIRPVLHNQQFNSGGLQFSLFWDRSLALEYDVSFASIVLYRVEIS